MNLLNGPKIVQLPNLICIVKRPCKYLLWYVHFFKIWYAYLTVLAAVELLNSWQIDIDALYCQKNVDHKFKIMSKNQFRFTFFLDRIYLLREQERSDRIDWFQANSGILLFNTTLHKNAPSTRYV